MANILQEEANFARVGRIVLDLNSKVQREYLSVIVPPITLPQNIANLKILNQQQKTIIQNTANIGSYDECDSSLLYILIRNLCNILPVNGWSKPVQADNINVADDVERLRGFRNELYGHATTAKLSNSDFNQFIQNIKGIMIRFDSCHGGTYKPGPSTGSYTNELNDILTSPIDPVLQNHYKTHFIQLMNLQANIDTITQDLVIKDSQIKNVASDVASQEVKMKKFGNDLVDTDMEIDSVKERVDMIETDIAVEKDKQVILKKRVDVNKTEIAAQKRDITDIKNRILLNQNMSDEKNENSARKCSIFEELIRDDDSSHSFQMRDSNWYLSCHHDEIDQPEVLINDFDREVYLPGHKKVLKSYQCGYTKYDNEAGYANYLIEKFDEQFGMDVKKQPWVLTNLHEDCVENRNFYKICRDVNSFCHNKKYSFLLIDISIEDNLRNLGFDTTKVKEELKVHDEEDPAYRILAYIGECDVILNIRYVDSSEEKDISDAVRKGQNDTKLFCSLHKDILQRTNSNFISLVVPNIKTTNDIGTCSKCISENLIVPKEKLYSTLEYIANIRKERRVKGTSVLSTERTFVDLASRLWGTLSIRDIHLPHLHTDCDNALERIYLNRDQRRFLHSKKKHAILRGGYGSGKSLLAQEKFKYLVQNAKTTEDIFYLCFNDETLFKDFLKEHISENINHQLRPEQIFIMNVDEYGKQFGLLPPIMFSEILNDIHERCKKSSTTPHIIADEFDPSNLTSNEGRSIMNNLQKMEDSYVLLISQSLESVRKRVKKKFFRKHEEKYEGQEFELTGMAITMLDSIMRNTTSINELSQATIRELEKHKSKIYVSDTPVSTISIEDESKFEQLDDNDHHLSTNVKFVQSDDIECCSNINNVSSESNISIDYSHDAHKNMVKESEVSTNEIVGVKEKRTDGENLCNNSTPVTHEVTNISSTSIKENPLVDKDNYMLNKQDINIISTTNVSDKQHDGQKTQYDFKSVPAIDHSDNRPSSSKKENIVDVTNIEQTYSIIETVANRRIDPNDMNLGRDKKNSLSNIQQFREEESSTPVNFYHVLKKMNPVLDMSSRRAIESRFRFPGKGSHGHKVTGKVPSLVDPFKNINMNYDNINDNDMKMRLVFTLQNIVNIRKKYKGMAVIVFEAIEAQIFHAIFLSMDISTIVYTPAIATGLSQTSMDDMVSMLKDHVLVTDHVGVRGLEFMHLLVTINPNEIYLYQYLVEALTRCLYDLSFIVFNTGVKVKGKFCSGDLMKVWQKKKLVQNYEIDVCELHREDGESLNLYCRKTINCYCIHTWHKDLKTATPIKHIKSLSENDNQLRVQYNRLLHHAYLEEDVRRKQDDQTFYKECTRRGYVTYKDIILGNERDIVDMLLKVKDSSYITNFRDLDGNSLLEISFLHCCNVSIDAIEQSGLLFSINYEKLIAYNIKNVIILLMKLRKNHILDYLDDQGNTLLHIASRNSWIQSAESMAYCEARNIKNNENKLPVDLAVEIGNQTIINLFNKYIDVKGTIKEYDDTENKFEYLEGLVSNDKRDDLKVLLSNRDLRKEHETTLLHNAARYNKIHMFDILTEYGCDIESRVSSGDTVLHYAAWNCCEKVVQFILENYPQIVNLKNNNGETFLHYAAWHGKEEVVKLILENYSQIVDVKNNVGHTILHYAGRNGKVEIVKLLLEKHPRIADLKDNNGSSFLHYAAWNGKEEVVNLILEKHPQILDVKNNKDETILMYAAQNGNEEMVQSILDKHPQTIYLKNNYGETCLHYAAWHGKEEVVKFIVEKYPEIANVKNNKDETILMYATRNGSKEMVQFILNKHPQTIHLNNNYGETCLHYAAWHGKEEVVKFIIEKYPEIANVKNNKDETILMYAARNGSKEMVQFILNKHPQTIHLNNNYGETCLHYAAWHGKEEVVKLILEKHPEMANVKNNNGETFLHHAAWNGKKEVVKFILEKHPRMADLQNNDGETCLHHAARNGKKEVMQFILEERPQMAHNNVIVNVKHSWFY